MNQSNSLRTHFPASYQKDFTQFAHLNKIDSRRMEEEPEKPLSIPSSYRNSFPKKRTYHKKNKSPNHNHGRWTQEEENLYLKFVTEFALKNPDWHEKSSGQKRILYFKAMSNFIGTRNAEQCRSKDQKMKERCDIQEQRRHLQETHSSRLNINQGVGPPLSQGEFNDQNRKSCLEDFAEFIDPVGTVPSTLDSCIHNVDIYFNFGSQESSQGGLRHDFDDNPNYF